MEFTLYEAPKDNRKSLHLKISNLPKPLWLSDVLPVLENMGLRVKAETTHCVSSSKKKEVWSHDFSLAPKFEHRFSLAKIKEPFETCLKLVWHRAFENNLFNSLIIGCELTWREVMLLRAYYKYLRQVDATHTLEYVALCFINYPKLTRLLLDFFNHQFNPDISPLKMTQVNKLLERIDQEMDKITNRDTDRILRSYLQLILGTVRTNYFQMDRYGQPKDYISFKIDSRLIPFLPQPRPLYEIFIYASYMEAIHLRGGKVARGGIRWSDRKEDFRTEVLGLMKAQMVKNAVIIPDGAKGGFIVKKDLQALNIHDSRQEAIRCYQTMIRGLLDITDSWEHGKIVTPERVRRLDDEDPYLVVAADKGTASFSDIANAIAAEYNFWLGDAFASGGSTGYDHKAMAITSRGAWEAAKRHFAEQGYDIDTKPFTVVGIGDMAGDIFGNGMLMSPNISLKAAFNHQHIFIDPRPDIKASFQERKRLFHKSRSAWADYDSKVLSKGGGIYSRQEKVITISLEAREALNLSKTLLTPQELIKGLLKAPVDLLWLGGIGTFVKAEMEHHDQVGDRSNDAIRVDGKDLQCKIVVEGANLGFTQLGRMEYAKQKGRINTDAIDNSAGVDCSDHEVNLKILFKDIIKDKRLTLEERNKLLEDMRDEVAASVLRDNYLQTQIISLEEKQGPDNLKQYRGFLRLLESQGLLDREVEDLPSDMILEEREINQEGLIRPELAVILSYGKLFAYDKIIVTHLPDSSEVQPFLESYFPQILQHKYLDYIHRHPLRREIITTKLVNEMVNYLGPCFLWEMMVQTKQPAIAVMEAYLKARKDLSLQKKWQDIESNQTFVQEKYKLLNIVRQNIHQECKEVLQKK